MLLSAHDVKRLKQHYGLTYREFGTAINKDPSLIYRIDNGEAALTETVANEIISRFNITPEKINKIRTEYEMREREKKRLLTNNGIPSSRR